MFAAKDRPQQDPAVSSRVPTIVAPAQISSDLRQKSQMPLCPLAVVSPLAAARSLRRSEPPAKARVFSRLRTLFPAAKVQHPCFHPLPHSCHRGRNVTPVFPITPALFARSWASGQVSTPLLSCACALFVKTTREGVHPSLLNFNLFVRYCLSQVLFTGEIEKVATNTKERSWIFGKFCRS